MLESISVTLRVFKFDFQTNDQTGEAARARSVTIAASKAHNKVDGNEDGDSDTDEPQHQVELARNCIKLAFKEFVLCLKPACKEFVLCFNEVVLCLKFIFKETHLSLKFALKAMDQVCGGHFFDQLYEQKSVPAPKAGTSDNIVKESPLIGQITKLLGFRGHWQRS